MTPAEIQTIAAGIGDIASMMRVAGVTALVVALAVIVHVFLGRR